jgi:hypothetical protein
MHFDTMLGAFGGFADPVAAERFQNRLKVCATIWCCVNQHPGEMRSLIVLQTCAADQMRVNFQAMILVHAGHVFYDPFFDTIPRTGQCKCSSASSVLPKCFVLGMSLTHLCMWTADRFSRQWNEPWKPVCGP